MIYVVHDSDQQLPTSAYLILTLFFILFTFLTAALKTYHFYFIFEIAVLFRKYVLFVV